MAINTPTHSIGFTITEYFCEPNSKSKSNSCFGFSDSLAATDATVVTGAEGQTYFVLQSPVAGSNKVLNGHVTTDPFIALVLWLMKQKMYWVQSAPCGNLPSPFRAQIWLTSHFSPGGAAVVCEVGGVVDEHLGMGLTGIGSFGQEGMLALHGLLSVLSHAPVSQVVKDSRSIAPFESHLKY